MRRDSAREALGQSPSSGADERLKWPKTSGPESPRDVLVAPCRLRTCPEGGRTAAARLGAGCRLRHLAPRQGVPVRLGRERPPRT